MNSFPLTRDELIAIRDGHKRNEDIRALLREIKRQNNIIVQVNESRKIIEKAWREETNSQLVALHRLLLLLQPEIDRFYDGRKSNNIESS